MKIKIHFVNMNEDADKVAFITPSLFVSKDLDSLAVCVAWLFWGVGLIISNKNDESE